ncbi:MAG: hypothetical protein JRF63_14395 [Deltaproteobacteria bacterium]|nr:hypothetical protein [Deltaproteobacteria bacterium]
MTHFKLWTLTLMMAFVVAALSDGCSIGGDEPWEDEDDDGGDVDSDSDSDGDTDSDTDGDSDSDTEGYDLSAADACDGAEEVDVPGEYYGDTTLATNLSAGSCAETIDLSGPDLVLSFYLETAGTFSADLATSEIGVPVLYLRDECAVDTTELACAISETDGVELSIELEPGDYSLFIDGNSSQDEGEFEISLTLE